MEDKDTEKLAENIRDYLDWMDSLPSRDRRISRYYTVVLSDFLSFVRNKHMAGKSQFSSELTEYLDAPLPGKQKTPLPHLYEHYLLYKKHSLQVSSEYTRQVRIILLRLHGYLQKHRIRLSSLNIEHLDAFMAEFNVVERTLRTYRYHLRGFLKYLYHERGIIKKDLAYLLVGPRLWDQSKPPKFLRPKEVQKLFASLTLSSPSDIRTYAIVHLAYFLGLRPVEISRITFDDISFSKAELRLPERKADNPITLPIPKNTVKTIAVYILKARPKSPERHLFLSFDFPYRPMKPNAVAGYLSRVMKKAGLPSSGYWLRHSYAQNLLQMGRSIYEIKEMMGHENIQSSRAYLHIHTEHMRKVLFNETL